MKTIQKERKLWEPLVPVAERIAFGKKLRNEVPRESQAEWSPGKHRNDPIELLINSNADRLKELLPIRYARMLHSPFAFLRGSAIVMASDLSRTPVSGMYVQCCGDCHLMNFGSYATPERNQVFDINDFDETLPAPWEWDVKRLSASFIVAGRYLGFKDKDNRKAVLTLTRTYRDKISKYALMKILEIWYSRLDEKSVLEAFKSNKEFTRRVKIATEKASQRTHEMVFPKLSATQNGKRIIKDEPPLIYHLRDTEQAIKSAQQFFTDYRETLTDDRKALFDRYQLMDVAVKVVGVGSVGTRCFIGLFTGEEDDGLFLQFKEGRTSVMEPYTKKSEYENHGERIVNGQRLMQAVSDIFLGWTRGPGGRDFYVRQLRDMKGSASLETYNPGFLENYALLCGWTLAKSHAKSGGAAEISGYIGKGDVFCQAIADFAVLYANQTEKDYNKLKEAEKKGIIKVAKEL